ncbi:UNVERIFIED_CONTAM: hypothetical protein ABIC26_001154 [Paenibacillus sp. PvR008]
MLQVSIETLDFTIGSILNQRVGRIGEDFTQEAVMTYGSGFFDAPRLSRGCIPSDMKLYAGSFAMIRSSGQTSLSYRYGGRVDEQQFLRNL